MKKKNYKVLYEDECGNYHHELVEAIDRIDAWKETKKLGFNKPYKPTIWIHITEL